MSIYLVTVLNYQSSLDTSNECKSKALRRNPVEVSVVKIWRSFLSSIQYIPFTSIWEQHTKLRFHKENSTTEWIVWWEQHPSSDLIQSGFASFRLCFRPSLTADEFYYGKMTPKIWVYADQTLKMNIFSFSIGKGHLSRIYFCCSMSREIVSFGTNLEPPSFNFH